MGWTKDSTSQSPKVIYTPDVNGPVGCTKLVYDPDAASDKRLTAYLSHLVQIGETLQEIETSLGF